MNTQAAPQQSPILTPLSWLQKHERIVMLSLVLLLSGFGLQKYFNVEAARTAAQVVATQKQLDEAKANSANLTLQASQTAAQYQAMVNALSAQNAALATAVAQRNGNLGAQQHVDSIATMSELISRWSVLVPKANFDGAPVGKSGGVEVNADNARATVIELEKVPVLTANLADETTVAVNSKNELEGATKNINALNAQVSGLNAQLKDTDVACKAEVASAKAQGNKGKAKWFKIGFVSGFVSGLFAGHQGL